MSKHIKPGHEAISEAVTKEFVNVRGLHITECCRSCAHCKSICTPNSGNKPAPHVCETWRVYVDGSWTCDKWTACENVKRAGQSEGKVSQFSSRYELLKKLVETINEKIELYKVWIDEHQSPGYKSLCDGKRAQIHDMLEDVREIEAEMAAIPKNERRLTPTTAEVGYTSVQGFVNDIEDVLMTAAERFVRNVKTKRHDGKLVKRPNRRKGDNTPIELDPLRRFELNEPATIRLEKHVITYWKR